MKLTDDERASLAEPVYDAYRLGKYGKQEYMPMWHELDHSQPPNSMETERVLDVVESIVAARLSALTAHRDELRVAVKANMDDLQKAWAESRSLRAELAAANSDVTALNETLQEMGTMNSALQARLDAVTALADEWQEDEGRYKAAGITVPLFPIRSAHIAIRLAVQAEGSRDA